MTDGDDPSRHRSPEELRAFIEGLSDEDGLRLTAAAARLARTSCWTTAKDLLHSAFVAAMCGERRCPAGTNPLAFLINAMRSILSNERAKDTRSEFVDLEDEQNQHLAVNPESPERVRERHDLLLELENAIRKEFGDDDRPVMVYEGRIEGMSRAEIRDLLEMEQTPFESLERRLRRFMTKYFSNRRAS